MDMDPQGPEAPEPEAATNPENDEEFRSSNWSDVCMQ